MKLFSSRGSKVSKEYKASKAKPRDSAQQKEVRSHVGISQPETTGEPQVNTAPHQVNTPPQPQAAPAVKHVYPEATLSEKQMAALHKVLGPSIEQVPGQMTLGHGFTQSPLYDPLDPDATFPEAMEIKDKGIAKVVTFVIFLFLLLSAAGFGGWYYWWTTYATFEYTLQPVAVLRGQSVDADAFLDHEEEDMKDVSAVFVDPNIEQISGLQYVSLTLTRGWRTLDTAAALYVLTPIEYIEHEFTEAGTLSRLTDFLTNAEAAIGFPFTIRFVEDPLPLEDYPVGEFPLRLAVNDEPFEVILRVFDTTPPTAVAVPVSTIIGEEVTPEMFVDEVYDASGISSITFFEEEPNVLSVMELIQPVKIAIEDIYGNIGYVFSDLTIELNRDPPVLEGTVDTIESEVGHPVDYPRVMTAYDDFGRELEVLINDSGVDVDTEGTYTVIYWAEDLSGQHTAVEVTVHIIAAAPEYIMQRADEILSGIIRDGMTQTQKVLAINNWVRWTMSAAESTDVSGSTIANAFTAIRDKKGNYIIFSAISELLLTRAGIPNMPIDRIDSAVASHRWNLVNPDGRGWYHFDTFPTGLGYGGDRMSMFTDSDADIFAERIETRSSIKDYYKYNKELYPEIVK